MTVANLVTMATAEQVVLIGLGGYVVLQLLSKKKGAIKSVPGGVESHQVDKLHLRRLMTGHAAQKGDRNAKRYLITGHHLRSMPNSQMENFRAVRATATRHYKKHLGEGEMFKLA